MGQRRLIEGVPVYFDPETEDINDLAGRIEPALALIRQAAPRIWNRFRRDIGCLQCTDLGAPGAEYEEAIRACVLDVNYVRRRSASVIASTIVHEAMHARIDNAGIAYDAQSRQRIERCCVQAQLAFVEALPGDQTLLLDSLNKAMNRVWYSDQQLVDRRIARVRALGYPEWYIRWLGRRFAARLRRAARPAA